MGLGCSIIALMLVLLIAVPSTTRYGLVLAAPATITDIKALQMLVEPEGSQAHRPAPYQFAHSDG